MLERKILDVALEHLGRDGYRRMSMDAVARDAGVTKPTIYRRWATKADLATAALGELQQSEPHAPAANVKETLIGLLRNFQTSLLRPNGMAMIGTLLAEEQHTPELVTLFRERIVERRRKMLRTALERGIAAREIREDVDVDATINMLVGATYARYLAKGRVPRDWPARIVEVVWRGIALRSPSQ